MKRLSEIRKELGWSQKKFADYFGVSVRTIQNWEQQRREPPKYMATLMERILIKENILEKNKQNDISEEIIFTDKDKLSEYNCELLKNFVDYLNKKHKKNKDVFHCGAAVQITLDKKSISEFNNLIMNKIFDTKE